MPRSRFVRQRIALIAVTSTLVGATSVFVVNSLLARTEHNRDAVRVSCQLLANAIVQSGGGGGGPNGHKPPQQELNLLYVSVIERAMTPADRRDERRLRGLAAASGTPPLSVPDCERIALHPESVQATPITGPGR